jgi:hypothetical protein
LSQFKFFSINLQAWEAALRSEGTPISKFYTSFRKVKEQERMKEVVQVIISFVLHKRSF